MSKPNKRKKNDTAATFSERLGTPFIHHPNFSTFQICLHEKLKHFSQYTIIIREHKSKGYKISKAQENFFFFQVSKEN